MAKRRALIIAPLYDGGFLPALAGTGLLVERLEPALKNHGDYDVKTLTGQVTQVALRRAMKEAFDTEGEVLVYFYGHGCVRDPGVIMLATSDGQADSEGIPANDFTLFAQKSKAHEVVLILDCCHAGAALTAAGTNQLREEAAQFIRTAGRALLAACSENQQGWEVKDAKGKKLGAFSLHVLDGLVAKAVLPGHNHVTASSLSNYVLEAFRAWNQTPVCLNHETGERKCVITSNLKTPRSEAARKRMSPQAPPLSKKEPLRINLPFKPSTTFVGRSAELDYLKALLIDGSRPIAVSATIEGLGGIGKTELVLQLLYDADVSNAFASIVWLDAAGPLPPQWASAIQRLGGKKIPSDTADILSLVTKKLDGRGRSLVVLDNATDWESARRFIPEGYPLLVTTRTKDFGGTDFYHRELGNLSDESAREFLIQLVPTLRTDSALPFLIQALGGHALAIELAGYHIQDMCSASEYLRQLRRNQVVFSGDALEKTHYQATVDACLEITWNSLKRDASRLLWRKASLFAPTSAHRDLLQASFAPSGKGQGRELQYMLYEMGYESEQWRRQKQTLPIGIEEDFNSAYAELRGCHVLARVEGFNGERWAMHRLVRDFARKRLQKGEIVMHSLILSSWLRKPSLPLPPEIPHFVVAILDFAREGRGFDLSRRLDREISHRSPIFFESSYMVEFLRDQLDDPKAIVLMFEGLRDINEDVRIAAIRLMEQAGPIPEVLNGLASALDDPDPAVRQLASETLSKHGGARTLEVLVAAIESPNHRARLAAVSALGLMGGQAHSALRRVANGADAELKLEAATLLAEQGDSTCASTVLEALQTDTKQNATHRQVEALGKVMTKTGANTDLLRGLAELLKSGNAAVRDFVAIQMGNIKDRKTVDVLAEVIADGNQEARAAAVRALGLIGGKAHALLREVADKGDAELKIEAATLLAEQKDGSRATILIESLDAPVNEQLLIRRLNALRAMSSEAVKEALRPVLKRSFAAMPLKSGSQARLHVALTLAELGEKDGIKMLLSWFTQNHNSYGDEAKRVLRVVVAHCSPPHVVRHIINGFHGWQLRAEAANLLATLKGKEFVQPLQEALSDKDSNVRKQVATALGKIGDSAARVALEKVANKDEDDGVKAAAADALKRLKRQ